LNPIHLENATELARALGRIGAKTRLAAADGTRYLVPAKQLAPVEGEARFLIAAHDGARCPIGAIAFPVCILG
jgi:hypothetical protein